MFFASFTKLAANRVYVTSAVIIAVIFAFVGAFDSASISSVTDRLVFWLILCLGILLITSFKYALLSHAGFVSERLFLLRAFLVGVGTSIICTVPARNLLSHFTDVPVDLGSYGVTMLKLLSVLPILTIIAGYVCLLRQEAVNSATTPKNDADALLLDHHTVGRFKVTTESLNPPLYLEAEDHYVKSVFPDDVSLVRTSLNDEAKRWSGFGFRIHRSYWVNSDGVLRPLRRNRQLLLELKDGTLIPVGRTYEKSVLKWIRKQNPLG